MHSYSTRIRTLPQGVFGFSGKVTGLFLPCGCVYFFLCTGYTESINKAGK